MGETASREFYALPLGSRTKREQGARLVSRFSQLPSARNSPYVKVACLGVTYSDPLQDEEGGRVLSLKWDDLSRNGGIAHCQRPMAVLNARDQVEWAAESKRLFDWLNAQVFVVMPSLL